MRKSIISFLTIVVLSIFACLCSCREDGDEVMNYSPNHPENFELASSSFTEQFKAFWMAMNCNYPMWDYEAQFGIDWDEVYDKYLPIFAELDIRDKKTNPVDNETLKQLYLEILSPLHDGHFFIQIKNLHKEDEFIDIYPSKIHNQQRTEYLADTLFPNLKTFQYYLNEAAEEYKLTDAMGCGELGAVNPSEYLGPYRILFGQFMENIVYLRLEDYKLCSFFSRDYENLKEVVPSAAWAIQIFESYGKVWRNWFNTVQEWHKQGILKGVVIDLRNNGGGNANYNQYILGALLPPNNSSLDGIKVGSYRLKMGIGRLDFISQLQDLTLPIYSEPHEYITQEPIVILVNSLTASLAEHSCLEARLTPNAIVIGSRTFGALNPSTEEVEAFVSGHVGIRNQTPFYAYIPFATFFNLSGEILESKGITPDIEIAFDKELYESAGRDSQLERALEYIRTGK